MYIQENKYTNCSLSHTLGFVVDIANVSVALITAIEPGESLANVQPC